MSHYYGSVITEDRRRLECLEKVVDELQEASKKHREFMAELLVFAPDSHVGEVLESFDELVMNKLDGLPECDRR